MGKGSPSQYRAVFGGIFCFMLLVVMYYFYPVLSDIFGVQDKTVVESEKISEETSIEEVSPEKGSGESGFLMDYISRVLLALCVAFSVNFLVILFYSREKKNEDVVTVRGNCSKFEITKTETYRI